MDSNNNVGKRLAILRVAIIVLSVLLLLSLALLIGKYVADGHFGGEQAVTAVVPDNLIGKTESSVASTAVISDAARTAVDNDAVAVNSSAQGKSKDIVTDNARTAARLELYKGRDEVNEKFTVGNMLPGDTVTKIYCVRSHHNDNISLFFKAETTYQTNALGDVLMLRVTELDSGKVLVDQPFSKVSGNEYSALLIKNSDKMTDTYYQIDVYLDTSVGNEYQSAALNADFDWYVKDVEVLEPAPDTGIAPGYIVVFAVVLILMIFVLLIFRRKKEGKNNA